jgi:hypothetical protein
MLCLAAREVVVCSRLQIYCAGRSERATSMAGLRSGADIYQTTLWLIWRNKLISTPWKMRQETRLTSG